MQITSRLLLVGITCASFVSMSIRTDAQGRILDPVQGLPKVSDPSKSAVRLDDGRVPDGVLVVDRRVVTNGDGKSWSTAFNDLQSALDVANSAARPVQLWVAAGRYVPSNLEDLTEPRSATFCIGSGVSLYGGFAGTEGKLSERKLSTSQRTILSGDLNLDDLPEFINRSENVYHVVTLGNRAPQSVLDGVFISGGNAVGPLPPGFLSGGGAVLVEDNISFPLGQGPTIRNSRFFDNESSDGGAVVVESSASFDACVFYGNRAIADLFFTGRGGAIAGLGLLNVMFVTNCVFIGNEADRGGAVGLDHSGLLAANCTFVGNSASGSEGAILAAGTTTYLGLTNCILRDNTDPTGSLDTSQIFAPGSINFFNMDTCNIQGLSGNLVFVGFGNFDLPSQFVDLIGPDGLEWTGDEDLRLQASSPEVDSGRNDIVQQIMGPEFTTLPMFDALGSLRILDGNGNGTATADLGAFERE